ncbi:MAG4530 family protein [Metamycoplasma buccale]|uniref:MAG4530 family protein n=1 Tax=Metamycoplasma buccale TaxID=55602 RepID=UPI00398F7922
MFSKEFNELMDLGKKRYIKKQYVLIFVLKILLLLVLTYACLWVVLAIQIGLESKKYKGIYHAIVGVCIISFFVLYFFYKSILILRFNYQYKRNIFKAFFTLRKIFILNFNWAGFNNISNYKLNIIKLLASQNLALQDSLSIVLKHKWFYRAVNDLEFISIDNSNNPILFDNLEKTNNIVKELANEYFYKIVINNNQKVNILRLKVYFKNFFYKKKGILIPKHSCQIAMKIEQILKLLVNYDISNEKIINSVNDLAFLISYRKSSFKKIKEAFILNSISDYFVNYFLNDKNYDFKNIEYMNKLNLFLTNDLKVLFENNNFKKMHILIKTLISRIIEDQTIKEFNYKINYLLKNREMLHYEYLNFSKASNKELPKLKLQFPNAKERSKFIEEKCFIFKNKKLFAKLPNFLENDKNYLDVRLFLLSKLDQM